MMMIGCWCCTIVAATTSCSSTDGNNTDNNDNHHDDDHDDDEIQQVLVKPILAKVNDLLRFLQKHQDEYFPQRFRKKTVEEMKLEQKWIKRYERKRAAATTTTATTMVEAGEEGKDETGAGAEKELESTVVVANN